MAENFISNLPKRFTQNTLAVCGESGRQWLTDLPQIIEKLAEKWSLKISNPFPNLSYNFVAPCVSIAGDEESVLKIALPLNNPEIFNEAHFLKIVGGRGAVKLLNLDQQNRALLLEKADPGTNLKELYRREPEQAAEITIQIIRRLSRAEPADSPFKRLDEWFNNCFNKAPGTAFPAAYLKKAQAIYQDLSTVSPKYLIHGDLHHENILSAIRGPFLAIDPKGLIGNLGYEIAVFLNNHLWWLASEPNLKEHLKAAIDQFSTAFQIESSDLRKWAFAQIVLSAWWTFDENGKNWETELSFAQNWER